MRGVAFDAAYSASKHALVGFARALALEYRKSGLMVAALMSGLRRKRYDSTHDSGIMRRQGSTKHKPASVSPTAAGRILPAEDIAQAVALLGALNFDAARALASRGGYPIVGSPELQSEETP